MSCSNNIKIDASKCLDFPDQKNIILVNGGIEISELAELSKRFPRHVIIISDDEFRKHLPIDNSVIENQKKMFDRVNDIIISSAEIVKSMSVTGRALKEQNQPWKKIPKHKR